MLHTVVLYGIHLKTEYADMQGVQQGEFINCICMCVVGGEGKAGPGLAL